MNLFQRLTNRPESAVARWRQHYEKVKETIEGEDRRIRATFEKLAAADRSAKELMASEPCVENLVKSVDAGARRIAAQQAHDHYCQTAGMMIHTRIEKALDFGIAAGAMKELRKMIETQKDKALADADQFAADNALDGSATKRAVERRYVARLEQVAAAENCLENTRKSTSDRAFYPSGLRMLNDYIEAALAGD